MEQQEFFSSETERLLLRPFTKEDSDGLYRILSDKETVRFEPYPPLTRDDSVELAREHAENPAFTAVTDKKTGTLLGTLYFSHGSYLDAEIGFVFLRDVWGMGYARESAQARITHGFVKEGLHRVEGLCCPENLRSIRLMERLGMRQEGVLRQNLTFSNDENGIPVWQDTCIYGLLREDLPWAL